MTTLEVLKAARAKIAEPEHWIQGEYASSQAGKIVGPTSPNAVRFCATGALCAVTKKGGRTIACHPAYTALSEKIPKYLPVPEFNDRSEHQEVLDLFDRAIYATGGIQ